MIRTLTTLTAAVLLAGCGAKPSPDDPSADQGNNPPAAASKLTLTYFNMFG